MLESVIKFCLVEKGRRLPIHNIHRWWSRRFSYIYRFILASYLSSGEKVIEWMKKPWLMRDASRGKYFYEPFAGGGTGL